MNDKWKAHFAVAASWLRRWWGVACVGVLLLVGLVAWCSVGSKGVGGKGLPVGEAFDSLLTVLPKGSVVVARFPDESRSDLYYLNAGVLYCFNGKSKLLEEMSIAGVSSGSIVGAKLSQDENYIALTVRQDGFDKLYRLNTVNRNIVDMDQKTAIPSEPEKSEEKAAKPVERKSDVPEMTDPLPEAVFADEPVGAGHEVKETAEGKKTDPQNTPEVTTISTE